MHAYGKGGLKAHRLDGYELLSRLTVCLDPAR